MITNKQKKTLEENYKNYYGTLYYSTLTGDVEENLQCYFYGIESTMQIVGFNKNDFIRLKNEFIEQYEMQVYTKFYELNQVIDKIEDRHQVFLYNIKILDKIIDKYKNDIIYGQLKNLKHEIMLELDKIIERRKNIKKDITVIP